MMLCQKLRRAATIAVFSELTRSACLLVVFATTLLTNAGVAFAHAQLTETAPANGVSLNESPVEITLVFTEPVTPVSLILRNGKGTVVGELVDLDQSVSRVILPVESRLSDGQYLVAYRVMSADTHPIAGAFGFTVGKNDTANSVTLQYLDAGAARSTVVLLNRLLQFISLLIASGTVFFLVLVRPPTYTERMLRAVVIYAATTSGFFYLLSIGIGGTDMAGVAASRLIDYSIWKLGASTSLSVSAIVGISGLIALAVAWRMQNINSRSVALLLGSSILLSGLSFTGHAATASPRWLMGPAVTVHLIAAAFWVAAILPLAWILKQSSTIESTSILHRFSTVAAVGVALLIASGLCISTVQIRSFSAVISTDYGRILTLKLGVVLILLAIAALNRFSLTRRIAIGDLRTIRRLRRYIYIEFVAMLGVLVLTTLLTNTVPPRALVVGQLQEADTAPSEPIDSPTEFRTTISQQGYTLEVVVSNPNAGRGDLTVSVTNEDGTTFSPIGVKANMSLPDLDIRAVDISFEQLDGGRYSGNLGQVTIAGDWELEVDVLIDDFTRSTFRVRIPIGR